MVDLARITPGLRRRTIRWQAMLALTLGALLGVGAGCGGGTEDPAYDRAAFCRAWADVAEGSEVPADCTDVAMPTGVGNPRAGAAQPIDPAVATTAWRACRALYVPLARDVPGATGAHQLATLDCMATKGWIQAFLGPAADVATQEADYAACSAGLAS